MLDLHSALDILPYNLAQRPNVKAVMQAFDEKLDEMNQEIVNVVLLARLDELESHLVDELAWQYHVDYYDNTLPIDVRRNLVRNSIGWHEIKGTPEAVEQVINTVIGGAQLMEWWEYDAAPYWFKVSGITGPTPAPDKFYKLSNMINAAKNLRSWCHGIEFIRDIPTQLTTWGAVGLVKQYTIGMAKYKPPTIQGTTNIGGVVFISKTYTIGG